MEDQQCEILMQVIDSLSKIFRLSKLIEEYRKELFTTFLEMIESMLW